VLLDILGLDGGGGLELGGVNGESTSKDDGGAGQHSDGRLEVSDEISVLLDQDGELVQQLVVNTFPNTNLGTNNVTEGTQGERKGGESLVGLSEESTGLLDLETVGVLELSLVDGAAMLSELGLTFTCGDVNIKVDNLTGGEGPVFDLLEGDLLADDHVVTVNAVLLDDVGKATFNHVALVLGTDVVHGLGHVSVLGAFLDGALSSSEGVLGSHDHVGLLGINLG